MRLLLLTMNPNLGASARVLQDWLHEARGHGIEPLLCLRTAGDLSGWLTSEGIEFQVNPMPWLERRTLFSWGRAVLRLLMWIRSRRIDVVHCYEDELWAFAWPLRFLLRAPIICHFHFLPSRPYAEWAFRRRWKKPDKAIWVSRQQQCDAAASVAGILPDESQEIVPLGIDLRRFGRAKDRGIHLRQHLGISDSELVVGGAFALRPGKRVHEFIQLSRQLLARNPQVHVVLAGGLIAADQDYGEQVAACLRACEANNRFHWLGHVEPLEPVLHACDIFVSTSEYETFGMSVCEAMACGKPVAAYRAGAVPEVVGEGGLFAEIGDVAGLSFAIECLLSDGKLRQRLGAVARQRVAELFNPRQSFEQLAGIYASLLGDRQASGESPPVFLASPGAYQKCP